MWEQWKKLPIGVDLLISLGLTISIVSLFVRFVLTSTNPDVVAFRKVQSFLFDIPGVGTLTGLSWFIFCWLIFAVIEVILETVQDKDTVGGSTRTNTNDPIIIWKLG